MLNEDILHMRKSTKIWLFAYIQTDYQALESFYLSLEIMHQVL
jgi:hypothetical protein